MAKKKKAKKKTATLTQRMGLVEEKAAYIRGHDLRIMALDNRIQDMNERVDGVASSVDVMCSKVGRIGALESRVEVCEAAITKQCDVLEQECDASKAACTNLEKRLGAVETWNSQWDRDRDAKASLVDSLAIEVGALGRRLEDRVTHTGGVFEGMEQRFVALENVKHDAVKPNEVQVLRVQLKEVVDAQAKILTAVAQLGANMQSAHKQSSDRCAVLDARVAAIDGRVVVHKDALAKMLEMLGTVK